MSTALALRWCADCRSEQEFEIPPCEDGHGIDCPDLACVTCGYAVVVGLVEVEAEVLVQPAAA